MMQNSLFIIGLSFMLIHEMDAIRCGEWRVLPGLSKLNEPLAFRIFMLAHIPLFFTIFWALMSDIEPTTLIVGLDVFFILHVILHLRILQNRKNEFRDWISWTFIFGAGLFGILDIFAKIL